MSPSLAQRVVVELVGTALLVGIGTGSIVAGARVGGVPQWVLALAWFAAVAVPVFAFARISGSHINPVVTLSLVVSGRFPAREAGYYAMAQVAGAFVGSAVVLATLGNYAHLGATLPWNDDLGLTFVLEFAFTFALICTVLFLTTPGRTVRGVELFLPPLVVGLSTEIIGPWTGSSLNPARTLAPAVLSATFTGIWVYFLATALAGIVAALLVARRPRPAHL